MSKIDKEPDNPNKLCLNLNRMDILEWFREKFMEIGTRSTRQNGKNRGMRI
jgi:hypothetical protein